MAKQSGGTRYKEWEMKDITTKPKGLRKSRMLKVKSTSSIDEEDLYMGTAVEGEATQRGDNHSSLKQLKRLSTIHHVSSCNVVSLLVVCIFALSLSLSLSLDASW